MSLRKSIRALSCNLLFCRRYRSPLWREHLALHFGRRLLLSDTVAGIRWGGEIWLTGEDSLYIRPISCHAAATDGRLADASLYLSLSTALLFWTLCLQTKGTWKSCGKAVWFGLHCEKWAGTSSCCSREGPWFHGPQNKLALFSLFSCDFCFETFAVNVLCPLPHSNIQSIEK